jgi:antitoxin VapB
MALNIKDAETERLAREVADLTGESKTGAIRQALRERKERLILSRGRSNRAQRLQAWLEDEVWPKLPPGVRGKPLTKDEEADLLGYGPDGV